MDDDKAITTDLITFKQGIRFKALQFSFGRSNAKTWRAKLGYYLWGLDIFIGNVPLLRTIAISNILVWLLFV